MTIYNLAKPTILAFVSVCLFQSISFAMECQSQEESIEDRDRRWVPVLTSTGNERRWAPKDFVHSGRALRKSTRYVNMESEDKSEKVMIDVPTQHSIVPAGEEEYDRKDASVQTDLEAPIISYKIIREKVVPIIIPIKETVLQKVYLSKRERKAIRKAWRAQKKKEYKERRWYRKMHKKRFKGIKRLWKKIF